jgi:hypothetical protein
VSVVNYARSQVRGNNAVLALGTAGALSVKVAQPVTSSVHVIIDVNGYFE